MKSLQNAISQVRAKVERKARMFSGSPALFKVTPLTEREALAALMMERRSVDLVYALDAYIWVYREDLIYSRLSDADKNLRPGKLTARESKPPRGAHHLALQHVLSIDPTAALFDIGCNYGREAIRMFRTAASAGVNGPVYLFDPGIAGKLTLLNLPLNQFTNFEYYNVAVSDVDNHVLVHMVDGQSQDNKIVNRSDAAVSVPVRAIRLDTFVKEKQIRARACFMKCDTQGAEFEVMRGFQQNPLYKQMAAIVEFFPNGLATRVKPQVFLEKLLVDFDIYNVGSDHGLCIRVNPDDPSAVFDRIASVNPPYTDLLLISKGLAGADELHRRIADQFAG